MKQVLIIAVILFYVGTGVLAIEQPDKNRPQEKRIRTIYRNKGTTLLNLMAKLPPADGDVVVVLSRSFPPLEVWPNPGVSMVEWKTQFADWVVFVEVLDKHSELTEDLEWIRSSVKVVVLDALKAGPERPFAIGQRISFVEDGGTVQIDGRTVKAVVEWAKPVEIGRRYLLFGNIHPADGGLRVSPGSMYELDETMHLTNLNKDRQADSISQLRLEQVFREIREKAQRRS